MMDTLDKPATSTAGMIRIPGAKPQMLKAGGLVFSPPNRAIDLRDWSQCWRFTF